MYIPILSMIRESLTFSGYICLNLDISFWDTELIWFIRNLQISIQFRSNQFNVRAQKKYKNASFQMKLFTETLVSLGLLHCNLAGNDVYAFESDSDSGHQRAFERACHAHGHAQVRKIKLRLCYLLHETKNETLYADTWNQTVLTCQTFAILNYRKFYSSLKKLNRPLTIELSRSNVRHKYRHWNPTRQ